MQAAIEASRLRLRPILMTSIAFVMGVVPLAFSTGAGAEMRQAMGIAVFAGMIGVTAFGLFLTPVFYVLLRKPDRQPAAQAPRRSAARCACVLWWCGTGEPGGTGLQARGLSHDRVLHLPVLGLRVASSELPPGSSVATTPGEIIVERMLSAFNSIRRPSVTACMANFVAL